MDSNPISLETYLFMIPRTHNFLPRTGLFSCPLRWLF